MRIATVTFRTDTPDVAALVQSLNREVEASYAFRSEVSDITLVSVEEAPRTITVTVADLVAAGVPQDTAERLVNGPTA